MLNSNDVQDLLNDFAVSLATLLDAVAEDDVTCLTFVYACILLNIGIHIGEIYSVYLE